MTDTIVFLLIVGAVVAGIALIAFLQKRRKTQSAEPAIRVYSDVIQTTGLGITLASRYRRSQEFIDLVDLAAARVFADAAALGYTEALSGLSYVVYVIDECTPSPVQGVPSFRVRADNYDGTVFDQDPGPGIGYVLASEYVIKDNDVPTGEFIICSDPDYLERNVRYGMEHIILHGNDLERYNATLTHSETSGHPLIPELRQSGEV